MPIPDWIQGVHDVTIVASNVAELRRFYGSLGFSLVVDQGDDLAVFRVGRNELAIHTSKARPTEALVLSILVSNIEGVRQAVADLGIAFEGPAAMRPGLVGIAIRDPNGNKVELLAPTSE